MPKTRKFHSTLLFWLLMSTAGCNVFMPSQFQSDRQAEAKAEASRVPRKEFLAQWVGKGTTEVEKTFGRPTVKQPTDDTGGTRYDYRQPGQQHYIFEFDAHNKVVNAAQVD